MDLICARRRYLAAAVAACKGMSGGGYRHLKNASPAKVQRAMLVFQVPRPAKRSRRATQ